MANPHQDHIIQSIIQDYAPQSMVVPEPRATFGDYPINLNLGEEIVRDYGLARTNRAGQFDVGGPIGSRDISAASARDPLISGTAQLVADVAPGSATASGVDRLIDLWQEENMTPIRTVKNAGEMLLESTGIVADAMPLLKAGVVGGTALTSLMALRGDDVVPGVARYMRGSVGSENLRHLQLGDAPHPQLKSALDDEGMLVLTHYSNKKLSTVDPAHHLTGLDRNTRAVRNRASDPDYVPRSSYMLETEGDRYVKEQGLGGIKNKVRIAPEQIYDPKKDPLELWRPGGAAPKTAEEVTQAEKRIHQAGFAGYYVNHPQFGNVAQVFDEAPVEPALALRYSHGELSQVPDVPQFPLPRYDAPRGIPKGTAMLMTPDVKARMIQYAEKGKEIGGKAWYNLTPLREAFIETLGADEGVKQFNELADIIAATSPRSTVYKNIVRGGFLRNQRLKGQPLDSFANLDKLTGKPNYGRANTFPPGKGHLAHETHQHLLTELQKGGHFESLTRPKTSSFAENLKGNQLPLTIDTHMMAALMGDPSFKKSPTKAQYKFLEDFIVGIAKDYGVTPAQFQSLVWMGAGTGVADARPYMDVFRDVVKHTAKELNMNFEDVVSGFIKGDIDLQQLLIPIASGSIIGGVLLSGEAESL